MAKKGVKTKSKDSTFELIKKIVIILAFLIGFGAMTLFILGSI